MGVAWSLMHRARGRPFDRSGDLDEPRRTGAAVHVGFARYSVMYWLRGNDRRAMVTIAQVGLSFDHRCIAIVANQPTDKHRLPRRRIGRKRTTFCYFGEESYWAYASSIICVYSLVLEVSSPSPGQWKGMVDHIVSSSTSRPSRAATIKA